MVYKKYEKRGGKTFGPYYYKSYRDKNGKVKKVYIGGEKEYKIFKQKNSGKVEQSGKHGVEQSKINKKFVFTVFILAFVIIIMGLSFLETFSEVKPISYLKEGLNSIGLFFNPLGAMGIGVSDCMVISSPGVYTQGNVIEDILPVKSSCINITVSDVEFDCAGYSIIDTDFAKPGIYAGPDLVNITIRNCTVSVGAGGYGIWFNRVSNSFIINTVANSNEEGIYLLSSSNNVLSKVIANSNSQDGILLVSSSNNVLDNVSATNNDQSRYNSYAGVYLSSSSNNIIRNSNLSKNNVGGNDAGIRIDSGSDNQIINNIVNLNDKGIYFSSSSNNQIINNAVNSNTNGIYAESSSNNNQIINNILTSNTYGFYLATNSNNNIFKDSILSGTTRNDTFLTGNSINNSFLNMSYDSTREGVAVGSQLIKKWYLDVNVNDGTSPVANAVITSFGLENSRVSSSSDSNGNSRQELIEYINNGSGIKNFYTAYFVNVSKVGYSPSSMSVVNMNGNKNILISLGLIISSTSISVVYPPAGFFQTGFSALNYTIISDKVITGCWYSNNSGARNSTTQTPGTNFTGLVAVEGSNTWTVYCNDNLGVISSGSVTFVKDTSAPFVNLTSPANGASFSGSGSGCNNVVFRFDASDNNGFGACYVYAGSVSFVNSSALGSVNNTIIASLANGTYSAYVGCKDKAGNRANSSWINITVNCAPGNDTINTTAPPVTWEINDAQLTAGYTQVLGRLDRIKISTYGSYRLIIASSVSSSSAVLNITSILSSFTIGEEKSFDTDGDGSYDITVTLNGVISGKAVVSVKKFVSTTLPPDNDSDGQWEISEPATTDSGGGVILIIAIIVIILIVSAIIVTYIIVSIRKKRMLVGVGSSI